MVATQRNREEASPRAVEALAGTGLDTLDCVPGPPAVRG